MLNAEEQEIVIRINRQLEMVVENILQVRAKLQAVIAIEEVSIHPKQALLRIAQEALVLIDGELPKKLDI